MADAQKPQSTPKFEIVSFKERLLASLIDWLIIIGIGLLILPIVLTHFTSISSLIEKTNLGIPARTIMPLAILLTIVFYNFLFEISMKGQTPGMKSRHIKVVKRDGSQPKVGNYLRRWVLRPIGMPLGISLVSMRTGNLLLAGSAAGLFIFLTVLKIGKVRRLHDWLSGTVIKSEKKTAETIPETKRADKPEAPASLIGNIAQVSQNARSIYLLFVGLLAYSALTVAGTSDRRLILNEPARLPVINLDVSLDGFFILAPILCIFMFVYFQLYLHKLKRLFEDLRTNFRPLDEAREIYPWMLNFASELGAGLVGRTQRFIVNFSLWWSMPFVLMLLAAWYLKKHDPMLSVVVGSMPLLGTLLMIAFWMQYQRTPGNQLKFIGAMRTILAIVLVFELYFFGFFMPRALRGERLIGTWPAVDLSHQNLVNKESGGTFWVNLRNARLQGADFTGAILEKADLRQANLEGAKLEEAVLRGANLMGANLRGTSFVGAKLDGADFAGTNLPLKIDATQFSALKGNRSPLRHTASTLSFESVQELIKEKDFFDSKINPTGAGYLNGFETRGYFSFDVVIYDHVSGLTWQQSGSLERTSNVNISAYLDTLNSRAFAGFNNWRLPTLEEGLSLIEQREQNDLYIDPIFDSAQKLIWTADRIDNTACLVDFDEGHFSNSRIDFLKRDRPVSEDSFRAERDAFIRAVRMDTSDVRLNLEVTAK